MTTYYFFFWYDGLTEDSAVAVSDQTLMLMGVGI